MNQKRDRKSAPELKTVSGRKPPPPIRPSVGREAFRGIFEQIGGPLGFLQQLVENAADAFATFIGITVDDRAKNISVSDNGRGMGPLGREAFCSLGKSFKDNPDAKGKYGTGAKSVYAAATGLDVCDRSQADNDRDAVVFRMTDEEALARYTSEITEPINTEWASVESDFPETGVRITINGFRPRRFPKADIVRDRIGDLLSPTVAERVRVNGQPLTKREIIGKVIREKIDGRTLGVIEIDIYIPKNRSVFDRLRIGAKGPVCTFDDFLDGIVDPVMKFRVPRALLDRRVCGTIDVPALNAFSTAGRKEFNPSLYEAREMILLMQFFEQKLAALIERELGVSETESRNEAFDGAMETLVRQMHDVFGKPNTGIRPPTAKPEISVNPQRVELVTGSLMKFFVTRGEGPFKWDASASGGEIVLNEGQWVEYRAGNRAGSFTLSVESELTMAQATVNIELVEEKSFKLSPASVTLLPGESVRVSGRNLEVTENGDGRGLGWRAEGGTLDTRNGPEVYYTAGSGTGTFELYCFERDSAVISAKCRISIVETRPTKPHGDVFVDSPIVKIEEKTYRIEASGDESSTAISTAGRADVVHFNTVHDAVKAASSESRRSLVRLLMFALVHHHVNQVYATEPFDARNARFGELLGKLMKE